MEMILLGTLTDFISFHRKLKAGLWVVGFLDFLFFFFSGTVMKVKESDVA